MNLQSFYRRLLQQSIQQVDSSTAVYFRIVLGMILARWAWDYLDQGILHRIYIEPKFNFTYYGFDWVQPLPSNGMYLLFAGMITMGVMIAVGLFYRAASFAFAIAFTYFFLLERTNYQNHYYLIALIAWWLPFLPLNRSCSLDARWWPSIRSLTVSRLTLWVLQFHLALPYVMGGIAKLHPDWLLGQPMSEMIASKSDMPILGTIFSIPGMGIAMSWSGLLFDLCIVPMLMWQRTRWLGFFACLIFHLLNAVVFHIHIFPWMMLALTPLFFEPDWIRRILTDASSSPSEPKIESSTLPSPAPIKSQLILGFWVLYCLFHGLWPLRHHWYEGDASWTEQGHYFAWRMMLRGKKAVLGFAVEDRVTGKVADGRVQDFLSKEQSDKFGRDPEMILHYGHFIAKQYEASTGNPASVYVLAIASLNGRKPELFIDPNRDLTAIPRYSSDRSWVMPQKEPLRHPAWDLPVEQWREHVEIPELRFLKKN
jgi:hypothetical protein